MLKNLFLSSPESVRPTDVSATRVGLNQPHGGNLNDLINRDFSQKTDLVREAQTLFQLVLTERQTCDVELLLNGGFSPLDGFLTREDYDSVLNDLRLKNGLVWPMPINLDVSESTVTENSIAPGCRIALINPMDYQVLAILTVTDVYRPDKVREAMAVFGKNDEAHPAVHYLHHTAGSVYLGGPLDAISLPTHYDFTLERHTPAQLRADVFEKSGWERVVAFQTRNPMHRAHRELTVRAGRENQCNILIHPVVGLTKPGDIDHYTRVRVYKSILKTYPAGTATVSLLPLAMRMGGPREALWHAIIRKNYGCSHFIIGRDHGTKSKITYMAVAGPGKDSQGNDFYGPYDAQELVERFKEELDITIVPFKMVAYLPETDEYLPADMVPKTIPTLSISGTELRSRLRTGKEIPDWFTYPSVQQILRSTHPPRHFQGFTVLIRRADATNSGFSKEDSIANALEQVLNESGQRPVTLITPSLSNSIGDGSYVAGQVVKNGGAVVAAPIFENEDSFNAFLANVEKLGRGCKILVVSSSSADQKKKISGSANLSVLVDYSTVSVQRVVHQVLLELEREGLIGGERL